MNDKLNKLFSIYPILKEIDKKTKGIIERNTNFKYLYAEDILSSGEGTCYGIIFILRGSIKVHRVNKNGEETNLYNISQGELCHEALSCLLKFQPLNLAGRALQDTLMCIIPVEVVKKYLLTDSDFLSYMYSDLHMKFNKVISKKEEKIHDSIETRILKYLKSKESKIVYSTHKDIAFDIDSSREVVSRELKKLERNGYIKLERGKITIIREGLR